MSPSDRALSRLRWTALAVLLTLSPASLAAEPTAADNEPPPFADIHLHYKWNQTSVTSVADAVDALKANNIKLAVVTGTPPELALKLADAAPDVVAPIYGIYRTSGDWSRWPYDKGLGKRVKTALESGRYKGIGEVHMISGFTPKWDHPGVADLFQLAAQYDVPVLLHTEFSRVNYVINLCRKYSDTRFLWAHSGAVVSTREVDRALSQCPNLWTELSARDPWRFVRNPIVDDQNRLLPAWRDLVLKWQDRMMVGSDPVWPVEQLDAWDANDTGWQEIHRFVGFHRQWLNQLPAEAAEKIRWTNAVEFFRQSRDSVK